MPQIPLTADHLFKASFVLWLVLLLSACGQTSPSTAPTGAHPVVETQAVSPTQKESLPMTPSMPTPVDSVLQSLVDKAKSELAQRLSVSPTQISLVNTAEVEWSDSSLGCPQPGMDYLQVITPGYRILLQAGGQQYEYHSDKQNYVVYCQS